VNCEGRGQFKIQHLPGKLRETTQDSPPSYREQNTGLPNTNQTFYPLSVRNSLESAYSVPTGKWGFAVVSCSHSVDNNRTTTLIYTSRSVKKFCGLCI
jgi:hypothetical protein